MGSCATIYEPPTAIGATTSVTKRVDLTRCGVKGYITAPPLSQDGLLGYLSDSAVSISFSPGTNTDSKATCRRGDEYSLVHRLRTDCWPTSLCRGEYMLLPRVADERRRYFRRAKLVFVFFSGCRGTLKQTIGRQCVGLLF